MAATGIVVVQTDFGLKDGAVSAVKGVMYSVNKSLLISDLSNEISPYNIWEAGYRLYQAAPYWPKGTVFVSVVDPGVGTQRRSIVAEANNGQFFVTPDNGTLTFINATIGIKQIRIIDETKNRLNGSAASYTFHGRDVYGYTAARLASGKITFEEVGPVTNEPVVTFSYQKPMIEKNKMYGSIDILDPQYGNVWTNLSKDLVDQYQVKPGDRLKVAIFHHKKQVYSDTIAFHNTFGEVNKGSSILYFNSLLNLSLGINQANFAEKNHIASGSDWTITIEKIT